MAYAQSWLQPLPFRSQSSATSFSNFQSSIAMPRPSTIPLVRRETIEPLFNLARSGDLQAITDWINTYLWPQGIYAKAEKAGVGCLQVQVEAIEVKLGQETDRLVKYICHLLWELNSPCFEGVRIMARSFNGDLLWKQTIRLLTPATIETRYSSSLQKVWEKISTLAFKTFRSLLLIGSSIGTLAVGGWVSYYQAMAQLPPIATTSMKANVGQPTAMPPSTPQRAELVQTALEVVPVKQHTQVQNPNDPTVKLVFGGNVTLTDPTYQLLNPDHNWTFAKLDEYRQADIAMVNLENPLTKVTLRMSGQQNPYKAPPEAVQVLANGGVDIVSLANDHAMDFDRSGLVETMKTLRQAGIDSIGAGRNIYEAQRPQIIDVKGQRIAYLAYHDEDLMPAGLGQAGVNARRDEKIAQDIKAIRNQVDWIIVNYHWGAELADYPSQEQINLGHQTIDLGADLVVGHHSHALQGAEIYKGKPIIYSLGNFIFGQGNNGGITPTGNYDTAVLQVALKERQMKIEFLPVEVRQYQARVVKGRAGDRIRQILQDRSSAFDQPMPLSVVLNAQPHLRINRFGPRPAHQQSTVKTATNPNSHTNNSASPSLPNLGKSNGDRTLHSESSPPPDHYSFIKVGFIKEPFFDLPEFSPEIPQGPSIPEPNSSSVNPHTADQAETWAKRTVSFNLDHANLGDWPRHDNRSGGPSSQEELQAKNKTKSVELPMLGLKHSSH